MSPTPLMFLKATLAVTVAATLWRSGAAKFTTDCGDTKGEVCSNWFAEAHCDTSGVCCHDDFNVWCCPSGYECHGNFDDPGGNNHCISYDTVDSTNSCHCVDPTPYVKSVVVVGPPTLVDSSAIKSAMCCSQGTKDCSTSSVITFNVEQTLSWTETEPQSVTIDGSVGVDGFEVGGGITLGGGTYTNSEMVSYDESIAIGSSCSIATVTKAKVLTQNTLVQYYSMEAVVTYKQCGVTSNITTSLYTNVINGTTTCSSADANGQC